MVARQEELKARVTAFGRDSGAEDLAGLHVAVMQYGRESDATGSDGSDRTLAELVDLASHTVRVFSSVTSEAAGAQQARAGRGSISELLDLLPTIAKTTSAIGGPAYDGAITAEALGLATAGAWTPPTVLPVLNLFAELPGVMTDEQANVLCTDLLRVADSAPAADIPGVCRALVNLVTKHPTSTVWPSTFRAVLQRVPSMSLPTAFCMIDLALQHAPATGGTLIASFQAEAISTIDVPEFMLLLILSQIHAYKEQALSLLTAAFAADAELDGERSQRSGREDIGHEGEDAVESLGATCLPVNDRSNRGCSISAIVQAVTSADARLARTLTELGLHWCDTAGGSNRAKRLRHTGCHLLSEVFTQHGAARREVLSVAFSAVIEEPSLQVKDSYCSLIEDLLTRHREMMNDHTTVLQAWLSSIQTLPFTLQKRIVNAVLDVAVVNGPLTSHVSMTMRKLMMEKSKDSRLVALHGLCAVLRTGVSQGAATYMADAVASLKSAFDMEYSVRKQLYLELAGLFRSCKEHGTSAVDVHLNVLQQRVRSQLLRYIERTDALESESAAQYEGGVVIRWSDCFDCVGQHAYAKEPLAELVVCVLELLSSSVHRSAFHTGAETQLLMSSVWSIVQQCSSVAIMRDWDPDAIISMQQKLGVILPLQQIILEWLPTISAFARETVPGVSPTKKTSDTDGGSETAPPEPMKVQQFWLTESYAMLSTTLEILGNDLGTDNPMQITPSRACNLLDPYLAYMTGTDGFRQAFGLPAAHTASSATPEQVPDTDTPAETRAEGGRVLRQRRPAKAVPWWVGNASPASSAQRRSKDPQDIRHTVAGDSQGTSQHHEGSNAEKAFPAGVYVCTDMIRRYLQEIAGSVESTSGSNGDETVADTVTAAFSQLVSLYAVTNSMQWDTPETGGDRPGWDSDDAASSDYTFSVFQAGITRATDGERRAYADTIIYPKMLQPIEGMVPKPKRSKLQLHSQQEMCYYKTRAACLDALSAAVTYAERRVDIPGGLRVLLQCPSLVEAYRLQPDVDAATAGLASRDVCAVYFSRQLRDEVAAGITPPLLTAYVRWIQCLLQRTGAEAPAVECRRQVAESFRSILSKFEIDAPGIVKTLLQALLDLSLPRDAIDTASCVVRSVLPKKLSKSSELATAGNRDDLLAYASLQCKHAAIRAAIRHLASDLKSTPPQSCDARTLAMTIDLLCAFVAEKSTARHVPLRPVLAGLVQVTIGRAADVGRVLYDTWPSRRRHRGSGGGRWRVDTIDMCAPFVIFALRTLL